MFPGSDRPHGLVRDEFTVIATRETEGDLAGEIPAPRRLIRLHLARCARGYLDAERRVETAH